MAVGYKNPKLIKAVLLATIIVALGGVIAIYIGYRQDSRAVQRVSESVEPDATLSINKIQQTATRDGKKEWSLEASSGHFMGETRQLILKNVRVTFFLKGQNEIKLAADQGILNTDSNDMEVSGHVVLNNEEYTLSTETLSYVHDQRVLYSKTPVTISGTSARLSAASLRFDLDSKRLTLEGGVATAIDEDFTL